MNADSQNYVQSPLHAAVGALEPLFVGADGKPDYGRTIHIPLANYATITCGRCGSKVDDSGRCHNPLCSIPDHSHCEKCNRVMEPGIGFCKKCSSENKCLICNAPATRLFRYEPSIPGMMFCSHHFHEHVGSLLRAASRDAEKGK